MIKVTRFSSLRTHTRFTPVFKIAAAEDKLEPHFTARKGFLLAKSKEKNKIKQHKMNNIKNKKTNMIKRFHQ